MRHTLALAVALAGVAITTWACSGESNDDLFHDDPGPVVGSSDPTTPALSADAGTSTATGSGACLPPDVQAVLAAKCTSCHAATPLNGSLSALVTVSDLLATSKEDATKNEAQLSLARMQAAANAMPPGGGASASDIATLQAWIAGGYASSSCGTSTPAAAPAPASDVFANAPAYVSHVASSSHNAGKDCMSGCHNHGFTFAGTLTDGAGNGVAGAEVRLVDANGKAFSVFTSSNGNFHSSSVWTGPAQVGVRNATTKAQMVTNLAATNGGCNSCHANGGTQAPIHLP